MFELDKICKECNGEGKEYYWRQDEYGECEACNGIGYHLTEVGKELLKFMRRWSKYEI